MTRAVEIMTSKIENSLAVPSASPHKSEMLLTPSCSTCSSSVSSHDNRGNALASLCDKKPNWEQRNGFSNHYLASKTREEDNRKTTHRKRTLKSEHSREKGLSPYEKLLQSLHYDQHLKWELALGKRIGFYTLKGDLGSGNFSRVKIGTHCLTKERVAIKILDKTKMDKKTKRLLSREISSMEKLHHPHIVRLYEVLHTRSKLYLVMEYACGGELFSKLSSQGKMPESDAKIIFSQIVSAVEHMHQHNIVHRDLKAENVFYSEKKIVKVGDFGFSTKADCSKEALDTFCGSPPYAAPELFRDSFYYGEYVDIWALGILLYFAVTGTMPFRAETVGKLKKRILMGNFTVPLFISSDCKHLIRNILKLNPKQRLSLKDIRLSKWLAKANVPIPTSYYKLDPSAVVHGEAQPAEAYALYTMGRLGINDTHMDEVRSRREDGEDSLFSWHNDSTSVTRSTSNSRDSGLSSSKNNWYTSETDDVIDTSSAIIGTYRILLLRGEKKMLSSATKEDILKFQAIMNHITKNSRTNALNNGYKPCFECGIHNDDLKQSKAFSSSEKMSPVASEGSSDMNKMNLTVSDVSSSSSSHKGHSKRQGLQGVVKSKFCTIL